MPESRAASTAASQISAASASSPCISSGYPLVSISGISSRPSPARRAISIAAVDVGERRVVVLQVVLDPGHVIEGVEVGRELLVGEPVEQGDRLGVVLARRRDAALGRPRRG